jgi:hypothetical protein
VICQNVPAMPLFRTCVAVLAVMSQLARPTTQSTSVRLVDVAAQSGLDLVNVSGGPNKDFIVDANGNGAALFDYDNDGDLDALIVNGSTREHIAQGGDQMVALYQNDGAGHFRDVTAASGFDRRGWGSGVCVGDIDNDGADDVYITAFGADALWRNAGKGTFVDISRRAGIDDSRWGTSCAFADYDHDGDLDLFRRAARRPIAASWPPTCSAVRSGCRAILTSFIATTATVRSPTCRQRPG